MERGRGFIQTGGGCLGPRAPQRLKKKEVPHGTTYLLFFFRFCALLASLGVKLAGGSDRYSRRSGDTPAHVKAVIDSRSGTYTHLRQCAAKAVSESWVHVLRVRDGPGVYRNTRLPLIPSSPVRSALHHCNTPPIPSSQGPRSLLRYGIVICHYYINN